MKVTLLVFTLNELPGINNLQRLWEELGGGVDEVLVVDGGSTDGTLEFCQDKRIPYFVQQHPGMGWAFTEGMDRVTGDAVITFSPDGNSPIELIPKIREKLLAGYDMVTVSRYLPPAKSYDDDWLTALGNRIFTGTARVLFRYPFTDLLNMYMGFRREAVAGWRTRTPAWTSMLKLRAVKAGLTYIEIPGDEPKRIGGKRKMRPLINGFWELIMLLRQSLW